MLKVTSRTLRAKTQAARVLTRFNKKKDALRLKNDMRQEKQRLREVAKQIKTSRQEAKEDRMLGPLAPRRALDKEEAEEYGAVSMDLIGGDYVPKDQRIRYWNIVAGDRVVILKGQDRHKIGVVKSVEKRKNAVTVEGLNMIPVKAPAALAKSGQPRAEYREMLIKHADVRLVHPLPDPKTGILKDAIIANVKMSNIWFDKRNKSKKWERLIPGMEDITIPWPVKGKPEHIDQNGDTRILDVETKTFTPTLLKSPFPEGVIDELRNKYSKFRRRHDAEFLEKKKAEDLERETKENARVLTPVQEINRKAREERKALGKPILSEEMLEKIGRVMAQNRPELLAGIQTLPTGENAAV